MRFHFSLLFLLLSSMACSTHYKITESYSRENVKIISSTKTPPLISLKKYSDSVQMATNQVIGMAMGLFNKEKPNSSLGNLFCEAMFFYAQKNNLTIDAAIANYGGIRLGSIPQGKITIGKIYELSPFENFYAVVDITGNVLIQWCDMIADKGGDPVEGVSFTIENKKAKNIKIKDELVAPQKIYRIATNDYLAMGNDGCTFLKNQKCTVYKQTVRQCIIDYIRQVNTVVPNNKKAIQ